MENRILSLYKAKQTIFTAKEIGLFWNENDMKNLKSALKYYVKKGQLIHLRKGIYAKPEYNVYEAAVKIYSPSYISFETVLRNEGVIFQYYETIFVASYISREIELVDGQKIAYRRIRSSALMAKDGVSEKDGYYIADKERAFLDIIYRNPNYYFDNLGSIDWQKCLDIASSSYNIKRLKKTIKTYQKNYA
jgi:predicted transcriptional regulator of viral defense system